MSFANRGESVISKLAGALKDPNMSRNSFNVFHSTQASSMIAPVETVAPAVLPVWFCEKSPLTLKPKSLNSVPSIERKASRA
jgi:hypothetical protein